MRTVLLVILCLLAACARDETVYSYGGAGGEWHLVSLNRAPFASTATLTFHERGRVNGRAPCNRFSAVQSVPYPWFQLGPIASTKRACPDLDQEARFFATLSAMTLSKVNDDTLILSNDEDQEIVFTRRPESDG